ncbi:hypothetical protein TYRP_011374 [Tyrophagus putrescentiae]|nr:hypothetical protein TYRP_011374 [Tyrophagus putrescentiae]
MPPHYYCSTVLTLQLMPLAKSRLQEKIVFIAICDMTLKCRDAEMCWDGAASRAPPAAKSAPTKTESRSSYRKNP